MNMHSFVSSKRCLFWLYFCTFIISFYGVQSGICTTVAGFTPELEDVLIGRCNAYQTVVNPDVFCGQSYRNCTDLWVQFSSAFMGKPPCNISVSAYDAFITGASINITKRQLFWSGTYEYSHKYNNGGKRFVTLEDTMIGYMMNGMKYCGGSDTTTCPQYDPVTCTQTADGSFWVAASQNFARKACGEISVMLSATRSPIYKANSFFGNYELPNLRVGKVTNVTVILLNETPDTVADPCSNDESLATLRAAVHERGMGYGCIQNPTDLLYLYCADHPTATVCTENFTSGGPLSTGTSGLLACLIAAIVYSVLMATI